MKLKSLLLLSFLVCVVSAQAVVVGAKPATLVPVLPRTVFVPTGFDNNDPNVSVVVEGEFPNSCYKVGPTKFVVDKSRKKIMISSQAIYQPSSFCLMMTVPYQKIIDLQFVPVGQYELSFVDSRGSAIKMGMLPVAQAKRPDSVDNYLYAPVDHIALAGNDDSGPQTIVLSGTFRNSCLKLREVKKILSGNVIELLPITEYVSDSPTGACKPVLRPFRTTVDVSGIKNGKYLVHVRAMGGQAINQIYDL